MPKEILLLEACCSWALSLITPSELLLKSVNKSAIQKLTSNWVVYTDWLWQQHGTCGAETTILLYSYMQICNPFCLFLFIEPVTASPASCKVWGDFIETSCSLQDMFRIVSAIAGQMIRHWVTGMLRANHLPLSGPCHEQPGGYDGHLNHSPSGQR